MEKRRNAKGYYCSVLKRQTFPEQNSDILQPCSTQASKCKLSQRCLSLVLIQIWEFHGCKHECCCLLKCDTVWPGRILLLFAGSDILGDKSCYNNDDKNDGNTREALRAFPESLLQWKSNQYHKILCLCVCLSAHGRGSVFMRVQSLLIQHATCRCFASATFFDII